MSLFSKKKAPTPAAEYSDVEQGVPKEQPKEVDKLDVIIKNQQVIAENQRVTFEAIVQIGKMLVRPEEEKMKTTAVKKK